MSGRLVESVFQSALPAWLKPYAAAFASFGTDDGRRVYPSKARIALMVGRSDRQVQRAIRDLRARGILTKVAAAGRHRAIRYVFRAALLPQVGDGTQLQLFPRAVPAKVAPTTLMGDMGVSPWETWVSPDPSVDPSFQYSTPPKNPAAPASTWRRLLAIAHAVIDDAPLSPSQWGVEMKARCLEQGLDYTHPMANNTPIYRRALLSAEATRGKRAATR